jgi:DNA-binding CsgD family transcriptional regulator
LSDPDILQKLASLTGRQREILGLVCQGTDYYSIAGKLVVTESTVKAHMGNIYIKLGLDQMPLALRKKALFELYCPALHEADFTPRPMESIEPEPVTDTILALVEADQTSLIPYLRNEIIEINPIPVPNVHRRRSPLPAILIISVVAILIFLGGVRIYEWFSGFGKTPEVALTEAPISGPTLDASSNQMTDVQNPTQGIEPTSQPYQQPTITPTVPIAPPPPTAIALPVISLPFSDNFDSGINPAWKMLNGAWFTGDGRATVLNNNGYFQYLMLVDPTWTDYTVSVDLHIYAYAAANQGKAAIAVRSLNSQKNFIGFFIDYFARGSWALLGEDGNSSHLISGVGGSNYSIPKDSTIEIEVSGSNFIARVNGREYQRVNYPGYDRGGVVLLIECSVEIGCPSFDNFSVR